MDQAGLARGQSKGWSGCDSWFGSGAWPMNLGGIAASQRDDFLLFFVADELLIGTSLLVSKVRR